MIRPLPPIGAEAHPLGDAITLLAALAVVWSTVIGPGRADAQTAGGPDCAVVDDEWDKLGQDRHVEDEDAGGLACGPLPVYEAGALPEGAVIAGGIVLVGAIVIGIVAGGDGSSTTSTNN